MLSTFSMNFYVTAVPREGLGALGSAFGLKLPRKIVQSLEGKVAPYHELCMNTHVVLGLGFIVPLK